VQLGHDSGAVVGSVYLREGDQISFAAETGEVSAPSDNSRPIKLIDPFGATQIVPQGWTVGAAGTACVPSEPPAQGYTDPQARYLTITPGNAGHQTALRVTLSSLHVPNPATTGSPNFSLHNGDVMWVGPPSAFPESAGGGPTFYAAELQCEPYFTDWSSFGTISVYGKEVVPSSTYLIETFEETCTAVGTAPEVTSLAIQSGRWADVVAPFNGGASVQPDFGDIASLVAKFVDEPTAPPKAFSQQQPNEVVPAQPIDFHDIADAVAAFLGNAYPYDGPGRCP